MHGNWKQLSCNVRSFFNFLSSKQLIHILWCDAEQECDVIEGFPFSVANYIVFPTLFAWNPKHLPALITSCERHIRNKSSTSSKMCFYKTFRPMKGITTLHSWTSCQEMNVRDTQITDKRIIHYFGCEKGGFRRSTYPHPLLGDDKTCYNMRVEFSLDRNIYLIK